MIQALNGYVMTAVGTATHYHTAWIMASWTPTLLKVGQFGSQIFFRPLGPDGDPAAFSQRYGGDEARDSKVSLIGKVQAATSAPLALLRVSTVGSGVAPRAAVQGGRMIVLPGSTAYLGGGRLRSILVNPAGAPTSQPPMHAMIALRAASAQAALQRVPQQPQASVPAPAASAEPITTVAVSH
jgi:hypothetical protein